MKLKVGAEEKSATPAIQVTSKTFYTKAILEAVRVQKKFFLFKIDEFLAPHLAGRRSGAQPAKIAPQGRFLKFKVLLFYLSFYVKKANFNHGHVGRRC